MHAGFLHGNEVAALNSTVLLDSAKFALRFALGIKPNSKEDSKVGEEQASVPRVHFVTMVPTVCRPL
jgi:hypothetical protein